MLRKLRLHNFRSFLNTTLEFSSPQLIIGKNNSGKTNLCSAITCLRDLVRGDLVSAVSAVPGGTGELTNLFSKSDEVEIGATAELRIGGEPHQFDYDLRLRVPKVSDQGGAIRPILTSERLLVSGGRFEDAVLLENDGETATMLHEDSTEGYRAETRAPVESTMLSKLFELDTNKLSIAFRAYLGSWTYYSLSPMMMRTGWRTAKGGSLVLSPSGEDLAFVLYAIKNMSEGLYRKILEHARFLEPRLTAINFYPAPDQAPVPMIELDGSRRASWNGLSDGTLRYLAMAYIAEVSALELEEGPTRPPRLIMIEEPENGIFPGHLRRLIELFEDRVGGGQFLFTTHSPYFINFFDARRSDVTYLVNQGDRTVVAELPPPKDDDPDRFLLAEELESGTLG